MCLGVFVGCGCVWFVSLFVLLVFGVDQNVPFAFISTAFPDWIGISVQFRGFRLVRSTFMEVCSWP